MYKKLYNDPDIYTIYVPLTGNPLKSLNCYVIKTESKNLIIDTGFNSPECYDALTAGLNELNIDINNTEMFLTHMHADHTGLVPSIMKEDSVIYMNEIDYEYVKMMLDGYWVKNRDDYVKDGFSRNALTELWTTNPAKIYNPDKLFNVTIVEDGFQFNIGPHEFTCISTPGHTPGHMCLYLENEKILFSGDHILFDISPNISRWPTAENSLKDYIDSLRKIKKYEIKLTLPAHRGYDMDVYDRIDQLIHHHELRLEETLGIVTAEPGSNAYSIAGRMKWSMKGKSWQEAPVQQKWFAVGETMAHLDYLEKEDKIYKKFINDVYYYYVK